MEKQRKCRTSAVRHAGVYVYDLHGSIVGGDQSQPLVL